MATGFIVLGSLAAAWISIQAVKLAFFIWAYVRPSSILRYRHNHSNSSAPPWAIITGASDGIGKAYAYELADRGFNIVLHGRNSTKLHNVRHELQTEYPHLSFRIIIADATDSGPDALERIHEIAEGLKDLHITILINNVGAGAKPSSHPAVEEFHQTLAPDIDAVISLNARFPIQFTRAILPHLLSHGGPALILSMGSMADAGMPYLEIYSACKAFLLCFSRALRREMIAEGNANVEVLGIMTGEVTDVSFDRQKPTLGRPGSRQFAHAAIERVGCGWEVVAPWWPQGLSWAVMDWLPAWAVDRALVSAMKRTRKELAKTA